MNDYETSCVVFAGVYAVLLCIVWASRAHPDESVTAFTHQKKHFHGMLLLTTALRLAFFVLEAMNASDVASSTLTVAAGFMFLSTFFLFLLLWANVYHQVSSPHLLHGPLNRLVSVRVLPVVVLVVCGAAVVGLTAVSGALNHNVVPVRVQTAVFYLFAVLNTVCALGFLWYGLNILRTLREMVVTSRRTNRVFRRIALVTAVCSVCFLVRAALLINEVLVCGSHAPCRIKGILPYQCSFYAVGEALPMAGVIVIMRLQDVMKRRLPDWNGSGSVQDYGTTPLS